MPHRSSKRATPPLDEGRLERTALRYVERFATTRAKLRDYLKRKLRERGWEGEREPPIDQLVERFAQLGYIDDQGFAMAKSAALSRRGFGPRRVDQALRAAGVGEADGEKAQDLAREQSWAAAVRFAERKRIGPFAAAVPDPKGREKAFAAMLRAGHGMTVARRLVDAAPGEVPDREE